MTKEDKVKAFINDGGLVASMKARDDFFFPINKFVSMDENGLVRVLVGGKCPYSKTEIIRNVNTTRYVNAVLTPIVRSKFKFVKKLKPVLTTERDFVKVINDLGGRCVFVRDKFKRTKMEQYKEIMDFNPTIEGAFKFSEVKAKAMEDGSKEIELEDMVTRDELLKRYNFFWSMDNMTSFIGKDGNFIKGMKEIIKAASDNNLPYGYMVAYLDNKLYALRCLDNKLLKNHNLSLLKLIKYLMIDFMTMTISIK